MLALLGAATCRSPGAALSDAPERGAPAPASATEPVAVQRLSPRAAARVAELSAAFPVLGTRPRVDGGHLVDVTFPATASGKTEIVDRATGLGVTFSLVGASDVAGAAGDAVALYAGAFSGNDVLHLRGQAGVEDFVHFVDRPATAELRYSFEPRRAHALRLVANTLELLDEHGAPRLRVHPPYVIDAEGTRHPAALAVVGCAVDTDPRVPWSRAVTPLDSPRCELTVTWDDAAVVYPALVDPQWSSAGIMTQERTDHTATLLPDGTVLIAGGFDASGEGIASAEIVCPDDVCPPLATFTPTAGPLTTARGSHTETLVAGGTEVLITGGRASRGGSGGLASAERYSIAEGTFTATSPMSSPRSGHTATLLDATGNFQVLVAGGSGTNPGTAERYDPVTHTFAPPVPMVAPRRGHVAELLLGSGKVLVAGGIGILGVAVATAELYDPTANTFVATGNMTSQRGFATATRLELGTVLVAGGTNGVGFFYKTADIFVPDANGGGSFQQQPVVMQAPRAHHAATRLLGTGKVLITGGTDGTSVLANSEIFDQVTTAFTAASIMQEPRSFHTATLLASGQALVTGGGIDPATGAVDVAAAISAEVLKRSNGEPCSSGGECSSGFCTEGPESICCDSECSDVCEACTLVLTGVPDGTCSLVPDGQLVQPGCQDAVEFKLRCNADGDVEAGDVKLCGAYACDGDLCGEGECTAADCSGAGWCNLAADECQFKQDQGTECGSDVQCESGFCTDGRCCNALCDAQCAACDVVGFEGVCVQATGAPHGARTPCAGTGGPCAGTCGSNPSQCDYVPTGCGPSSCSDGLATAGTCHLETQGECGQVEVACGEYVCNPSATACLTGCETNEDCTAGRVCLAGGTCALVEETVCDGDHKVISPDGTEVDCSPYRCQGAACLDRCRSVDECVAPTVCDSSGLCVAPPADPAPPTGCAVAPAAGSQPLGGAPWLAAALLAAGLVFGRRRALAGEHRGSLHRSDRVRSGAARRAASWPLGLALWIALEATALAQQPPPPPAPTTAPSVAPGAAQAPEPPATAPAETPPDQGPDPANKPEAEKHFQTGIKLLAEDAWTAALASFLRSRELYPTRNATNNAAFCLRKLNRFDEALDMYETLLREFANMPADRKAAAQKEVAELRGLVGTIDISGAEPGAAIVVDGKARQDYPLIDPLRVAAGTHAVRIFKEGFQPFETRVDVAGGQTVRVVAKMPALTASGRLRVVEKSGKALDVVVDGAIVGVTPWEGSLAVGEHVVLLRGDEDLGTQPAAAPVQRGELTSLTLAAERLEGSLLIDISPAGAKLSIDSVVVGRGIWDGRLRAGSHTVEAFNEGFYPVKQQATIERGERKELKLALQRDADAEQWRTPSKVTLDLSGGFALAPSFGGEVAGACEGSCDRGLGMGGLVMLHAGYEFGSGFGLGLAGGFLHAEQDVSGREASISPTGLDASPGTADDRLRLRGYLIGLTAGMHLGDRFPIRLRLGAGAMIGSARSERTGDFSTRAGSSFQAPAVESESNAAFVYIDPEASVGVRIGDRLELSAGVQALFLIAASEPSWGDDEDPEFVAQGDGLSRYPNEPLVGSMAMVIPGINLRYAF